MNKALHRDPLPI